MKKYYVAKSDTYVNVGSLEPKIEGQYKGEYDTLNIKKVPLKNGDLVVLEEIRATFEGDPMPYIYNTGELNRVPIKAESESVYSTMSIFFDKECKVDEITESEYKQLLVTTM